MEAFYAWFDSVVVYMGGWQLCVAALVVVLLVVQLVYYVGRYASIASFRSLRRGQSSQIHPVSVVVPVFNADFNYLQYTLPRLLDQSHPDFEVVLVDVTGDEEFGQQLKLLIINHSNFNYTRIKPIPHTPITNKMALNVGIKAAHNECIILTGADCWPVSNRWLEIMSKGFSGGDVVLGYCGVEECFEPYNAIKRVSRMAQSMRWLSSAVRGKPYRGTLGNMGFTKSLYFANRGFNYLSLNVGEDDLFVMKIARADNTRIVVSANSIVRQSVWGGSKHWFEERRRLSATYRYYPSRVRFADRTELWSRALFFASVVVVACFTPLYGMVFALSALVLRFAVVMFEINRIARRLSEHVLSVYPLYDLFAPAYESVLALSRRRAHRRRWK